MVTGSCYIYVKRPARLAPESNLGLVHRAQDSKHVVRIETGGLGRGPVMEGLVQHLKEFVIHYI